MTHPVLDGVTARRVERPATVSALAELLRDGGGCSVVPVGAATKVRQGAPPESADLVVDTRGLDRIVEHAAGDLVVTVEAGLRLADLQAALAGSGQWLALDPPERDATIGGVVAAAASGPRRLRWGTPRDLLIGITVVLADGTVARSGGKVVKNVAGYDLGKLFTGSFGSLGVIAQCTFRLHPRPAALRAVTATPPDVAAAVATILATGVQPSALEYDGRTVTVVVEGTESVAAAQAEQIAAAVDGTIGPDLPEGFGAHPWGRPGHPVGLKATHRIGGLAAALDAVRRHLPGAKLSAHAASGVVWVGTDDQVAERLTPLRNDLAALDGQVVVVTAPLEVKQRVDVWGPSRGLPVMRRIKEQFDPERRMSPGRFVGGL